MPSETISIKRELLKSPVFRSLSGTAKTVYFDFLMKRRLTKVKTPEGRKKEWVIVNNGKIEYPYDEAEARDEKGEVKGISRPRFARAIDELVEKGFIDIARSGSGGRKGDTSKYAISERWQAWGTDEFIEEKRAKDTREGRGWSVYWAKKKQNREVPTQELVVGSSVKKKKVTFPKKDGSVAEFLAQ